MAARKRRKVAKKRANTRSRTTRRTSTKSRKSSKMSLDALDLSADTHRQISGYVQITLAVIFLLIINGSAGIAGDAIANVITFFFGSASIVLPIALAVSGLFLLLKRDTYLEFRSAVGMGLCLAAVLGLVHIQAPFEEIGTRREELGGAIGFMVSFPLLAFTSVPVAYVVLSALFLIGLLVTFEMGIGDVVRMIHNLLHPEVEEEVTPKRKKQAKKQAKDQEDLIEEGMHRADEEVGKGKKAPRRARGDKDEEEINIVRPAFAAEEVKGKKANLPAGRQGKAETAKAEKKERPTVQINKQEEAIEMQDTHFENWEFPTLDCLAPGKSEVMVDDETLKEQAKMIEQKLKEFDVEVTVRDAHPGPTVTQFTLQPAEGVKLSRIANLKNDLALALAAPSLRIEAPIPGKSLVGIEMPNPKRTTVHLRELLESPEFQNSTSPLTLPLGRDVSGNAVVEELAEMPHLMIAGATGAGKSVCMNTFLLSLLYQNAPHDLKLILVDPKRVEMALYEGIPHLLTPVITEAEKALKALRWVVAEVGRRLAKFSEVGVRNLDEYNSKQDEKQHMPRVVVVIDELADLMMRQYRRDTEVMITRIAQIARATGMHLIIATQRPSVDVITGIIKANIPCRIAFRTVSSIDSRTILDQVGSEDLLGKGDLLYTTASTPMPVRVQGVLVTSEEVERVINQVKIAGGGQITAEIPLEEKMSTNVGTGMPSGGTFGDDDDSAASGFGDDGDDDDIAAAGMLTGAATAIDLDADDDGGDDLTFEAIELVRSTGKASASLLQRHLKVGYARAARILDILEEKGVIGPGEGAKARKVYVQ